MPDLPDEFAPKKRISKEKIRQLTLREQQTKSALYHLTPMELRFVKAHVAGQDYTQSCKAAGFTGSDKRAKARGWRIMQRPVVRAALYELMVEAFDKSTIEVTQWLRETASIAFMPAEMLEGRPRWSDKMNALTKIGEFQKLLDKSAPSTREVNVITLITQAAKNQSVPVVDVPAREKVDD